MLTTQVNAQSMFLQGSRNFVIYNVKFQGKKLSKAKETGLNCRSTFPKPLSNEAVCCK